MVRVMATVDKRRRNARRSKYRPRTDAQKQRRKELWAAREADRKAGRRLSEEEALTLRLEELEAALRDQGHVGIHNRRHVTPLDEIEDDVQRFAVLKARVERLEALWAINQRKRETRGKIIIGGALLAEAADFEVEDRDALLERLVDILDRRVERRQLHAQALRAQEAAEAVLVVSDDGLDVAQAPLEVEPRDARS
mgnify:CR=1 FL=1